METIPYSFTTLGLWFLFFMCIYGYVTWFATQNRIMFRALSSFVIGFIEYLALLKMLLLLIDGREWMLYMFSLLLAGCHTLILYELSDKKFRLRIKP